MLEIGEIKTGKELGYTSDTRYKNFIWSTCPDCDKGRWVQLINGLPKSVRCMRCYHYANVGANNPCWKGGRLITPDGYIRVKSYPDDFFYSMANRAGYIFEHRLVMAKYLGRCLHRWEIVHHRNGIRDDNRIKNLQLVTDERHKQITLLENRISWLEKRVTLLEAENALLIEGKLEGRK